jgi:hypothetical protein
MSLGSVDRLDHQRPCVEEFLDVIRDFELHLGAARSRHLDAIAAGLHVDQGELAIAVREDRASGKFGGNRKKKAPFRYRR